MISRICFKSREEQAVRMKQYVPYVNMLKLGVGYIGVNYTILFRFWYA